MTARTCQRVFAILLLGAMLSGVYGVLHGSPAWPLVAVAVLSSIGMQIAGRIARGIPVFAVGSEAQPRR